MCSIYIAPSPAEIINSTTEKVMEVSTTILLVVIIVYAVLSAQHPSNNSNNICPLLSSAIITPAAIYVCMKQHVSIHLLYCLQPNHSSCSSTACLWHTLGLFCRWHHVLCAVIMIDGFRLTWMIVNFIVYQPSEQKRAILIKQNILDLTKSLWQCQHGVLCNIIKHYTLWALLWPCRKWHLLWPCRKWHK